MVTDASLRMADPGMTVDVDNPWPGLLAYREADRQFFRGRDRETEELFRLVMSSSLTVLFGQSGLGKTSLLQAGLFPRVREEDVLPIYIRLAYSPDHPRLAAQIRQAIALEATAANVAAPAGTADDSLWEFFHRRNADFWSKEDNRLILPLLGRDQFEEMFTLGRSDAERARATEVFLTELSDLIEGRPPRAVKEYLDAHPSDAARFSFARHRYKVLLSVREDFLPEVEALRSQIPSLAHNRMRLQRMNGGAAREVVAHAQHLIERPVAEQVVRFVAAGSRTDSPLETLDVEPALLSVVCRELNHRRQQRNESRISAALLEGSRDEILKDFYERSVGDLEPNVRAFVEEKLLTVSGYRDSVALENALSLPGVTREAIARLVDRRLLRTEERAAGMQRLELTHDLLTGVIAASRNLRRRTEEGARREREHAEREKHERLEERARSARRFRALSGLMAGLVVLAVSALVGLWQQTRQVELSRAVAVRETERAEEALRTAERAREEAEREMVVARQLYERITASVRLRQAVLSRERDALRQALERMPVEMQIKFDATAHQYPYRSVGGLPTFKFQMFPVENSIPGGFKSIALITYIMDHPTFLNPLLSTGPDTRFTGTYDGVGCLPEVTAVIEYADLDRPLALAQFDMCALMRRV